MIQIYIREKREYQCHTARLQVDLECMREIAAWNVTLRTYVRIKCQMYVFLSDESFVHVISHNVTEFS